MKKHLVIGATGTVGSHLVDLLTRDGQVVRAATSRTPPRAPKEGVEWVQIDLATGAGVDAAFDGVHRAFLLAPPGYADQHKLLSPLIAAAKRHGLEKVVLMSAMGANAGDTPFRRSEVELERSGIAWNIIRPNWFMQNFNTFWVAGIRDDGKIRLPVGRARTSFIDARDIASVAARLLTSTDLDNRDFDLTGPVAIDHDAVARMLSEATGRTVVFEDIEPGVLREGLLGAGLPPDYVEFLGVILGFLAKGYAERTTDSVRQLLGREPIRFEQYARQHRAAWARAA